MRGRRSRLAPLVAGVIVGAGLAMPLALGQQVPGPGGVGGEVAVAALQNAMKVHAKEGSVVSVSQAVTRPGSDTGWHSHRGLHVLVVQSGTMVSVEAQAKGGCKEYTVSAGSARAVPEGVVHTFRNPGSGPATWYLVWVFPPGTEFDPSPVIPANPLVPAVVAPRDDVEPPC